WLDQSHVAPSERARVVNAGLGGPSNPCTTLPAEAYHADMGAEIAPGRHTTAGAPITATVRHHDARAPRLRPSSTFQTNRSGVVDISATVVDEHSNTVYERTIPLPRTVFPGEQVQVRAPLVDPLQTAARSAVRAHHTYSVRVALAQQGVRRFGGPDGSGVTRL